MKRTPMKRGKGFRMRDYQSRPPRDDVDFIEEIHENGQFAHHQKQAPKPLVRGVYGPAQLTARPREPKPIRSEEYRRLVASLPCFHCQIEGRSQAAHPNSGKAKGAKLSDLDCFPLCADVPGAEGCHKLFDTYRLVAKGDPMRAFEKEAKDWTQRMIRSTT